MNHKIMLSALVPIVLLFGSVLAGTPQDNKDLVVEFIEALNAKDFERLPDFITEDFTRHSQASPNVVIESKEQFKFHMRDDLEVFPDARQDVRQIIAEGDKVAIWANYMGTYKGRSSKSGLVGPKVNIEMAAIFRIEGGKLAEVWVTWDNKALEAQLKALE